MTGVVASGDRRARAGAPVREGKQAAETAGRIGLAARGVIYLVVAVIAARIALGMDSGDQADHRGAIDEIAEHSYGTALLVLLAVGFACYALWRGAKAVLGEEPGEDPKPYKRLADVGRAVVHVSLALTTIRVLQGDSGSGRSGEEEWTARLMEDPWGRWLVGAVGAAFVVGGLWLIWRGFGEKFRRHLERYRPVTVELGKVGHVGKGIAFAFIGGFVVRAAVRFDAAEPIGLDGALRDLAQSGWGRAVVVVVAVGLAAFGLFSMAESRDRRVLDT